MGIRAIEGVTVMVSDQQRAVDFYTNRLGFEKKLDTNTAGYRWVVVGPKDSDTVISLVEPSQMNYCTSEQKEQASAKIGTNTGIWFYTDDIDSTYKELKSKQVKVTQPEKQVWGGMMCQVLDQDRNSIGLVGDSTD